MQLSLGNREWIREWHPGSIFTLAAWYYCFPLAIIIMIVIIIFTSYYFLLPFNIVRNIFVNSVTIRSLVRTHYHSALLEGFWKVYVLFQQRNCVLFEIHKVVNVPHNKEPCVLMVFILGADARWGEKHAHMHCPVKLGARKRNLRLNYLRALQLWLWSNRLTGSHALQLFSHSQTGQLDKIYTMWTQDNTLIL